MKDSCVKTIPMLCILASAALLSASFCGIAGASANEPAAPMRIVFFGDSITARWPWFLLLPD